MLEVKLNDEKISIPQSYEVLGKSVILLSPFLIRDTVENRIELLKSFFPQKLLPLFYALRDDQVHDILTYLDWAYDEYFDTPVISVFKVGGIEYYLPEQYLKRCNVIEYTYADRYFEMVANGDYSKIDNLILSLCRPKRADNYNEVDFDGDVRERFNPVLIEKRLKNMEELSIQFKMYFLLFFIGCKKTLAKKYVPLFRKRDEEEEESSSQPDFGWIGIIWDLAGGIADEEKIQYSKLHNVMAFLCKKHYDNEAIKQAQKRNAIS
jgi:hypothetical protein